MIRHYFELVEIEWIQDCLGKGDFHLFWWKDGNECGELNFIFGCNNQFNTPCVICRRERIAFNFNKCIYN